jgi:hypothetical protein
MIKQIDIWDMDGTIVDSSHRYRLGANGRIDLQHWIDNEHLVLGDTLLPLVDTYRESLADDSIYTIIATARTWCNLTETFARDTLGYPDHVIARKNREDTRGGAELKIHGIKKLLNLKQFQDVDSIHVFEDNADYLKTLCDTLGATGHYFPSVQGY